MTLHYLELSTVSDVTPETLCTLLSINKFQPTEGKILACKVCSIQRSYCKENVALGSIPLEGNITLFYIYIIIIINYYFIFLTDSSLTKPSQKMISRILAQLVGREEKDNDNAEETDNCANLLEFDEGEWVIIKIHGELSWLYF